MRPVQRGMLLLACAIALIAGAPGAALLIAWTLVMEAF